jgi:thiol-disulfide isomerase/thioredoxin
MVVRQVQNEAEYRALLANPHYKKTIVLFQQNNCQPCNMVKPHFDNLSNTYTNIQFLSCGYEHLYALGASLGISTLPAFFLYKNGQKIYSYESYDVPRLVNTVKHFDSR